jgi:hypothetical protein
MPTSESWQRSTGIKVHGRPTFVSQSSMDGCTARCLFHLVDPGTLGPAAALGRGPLIRRTPSVDHLGSVQNHRGVGSSARRRTHRPATST